MSKAAAIEFLEEQLINAEAEVQAIKLLLARHKGMRSGVNHAPQPAPLPRPSTSSLYEEFSGASRSVADLVRQALDEANKPQRTEQLLAFLASHGKTATSATLRSAIHQYIKRGKRFKSVAPGLYGLIEWA
ncbi:MAG: hypothetical protein Q7U76_17390 [Nitrospirota bacterium]|nr:hypothetical protein [Nitrospirota bacterium]